MTFEELQELSKPFIDGSEEFESYGHEKGMQSDEFLEDVEEHVNSDWQPSNNGKKSRQASSCSLFIKRPAQGKIQGQGQVQV